MAKVVKKRIKVKWKNMIIFLCIIIFIVFSLIKATTFTINTLKKINTKEIKEEKKNNKETKKEKTNYERKLDKLNNIDKEINYFVKDNINRYIDYKNNNKHLDIKQVILDVNMDLDKEYYSDAKKALNENENTVIVNKYNYLEDDYIPENLQQISKQYALNGMKLKKEAKEAFEEMAKAASKDNMKIVAMSAYRSYDYQIDLYNRYAKKDGREKADTYSGRPGYSEHQTGLAVDIYNGVTEYTKFENTKEFEWMKSNAYKYGYILRFPIDKEKETGYVYESWHYRYIGKTPAKYIYDNKICLEEYYATKLIQKK